MCCPMRFLDNQPFIVQLSIIHLNLDLFDNSIISLSFKSKNK